MAEARKVIFDTDPGVDDAMALLFLRGRPDVELVAITTVFGNAHVDITTRNALYLCDRFGISAPVYRGAVDPLVQKRLEAPAFVHGHDGLGDVGVADGFAADPAPGEAHQAIVDLVRANPGKISILAVGPLTNLALALQADPGIAGQVREVVIMGGAFWANGNVSPVAEANIRCDPHAADVVFTAPWPLTAVGLDVTHETVMSREAAAELAEHNAAGRFLWDISRDYEALYQSRNGFAGCALHDVTAAIRMVRPDLFQERRGPIRVVADGIAVGQTIQQPTDHAFPPGPWDGAPLQAVCHAVDEGAVVEVYRQTLSSLA
jgi:inosine-uridine nucleoside N-ribohydrolase